MSDEAAERIDALCHVLSNERRRAVIRHLSEVGEPAELGTIADEMAAAEFEGEHWSKRRQSIYSTLYQCHAPKLASEDVVTTCRGTVLWKGERFEEFLGALEIVEAFVDGGEQPGTGILDRLLGGVA